MTLRRVLARRDVFALAFGAIIGWGWVVLSGSMIDRAGSLGSVAAVLIGAVMVGLVGLAYGELTAAFPRAGGELGFTYAALGPAWSWWCGWWLALAYVGVCGFEAVAIGTVLTSVAPQLGGAPLYDVAGAPVYPAALAAGSTLALVIGVLNWRGMKLSAGLQWIATMGLLALGLALFLAAGVRGDTANLDPQWLGWEGLFGVVTITPFLFVGFDVIPQVAEETRIPRQQIGGVILFSIGLAATWYALVQLSVGVGLPLDAHAAAELPTAAAATRLAGSPAAGWAVVVGGVLGIVTSWNAFFIGATRLLFAMGRSRMLPEPWARLHERHGTPVVAVASVTALSMLAPLLGRQALLWIANAASLATVVAFVLVAVSFVRLRRRAPDLDRPYRVAGGAILGPVAVAVTGGFVLLYLPPSPSALTWPYEWGIIAAWVATGAALFARARRTAAWHDRSSQARALLGEYRRSTS